MSWFTQCIDNLALLTFALVCGEAHIGRVTERLEGTQGTLKPGPLCEAHREFLSHYIFIRCGFQLSH